MDCEGYEVELLNSHSVTIFKNTCILVEVHEMYEAGCTNQLRERFSSTHNIQEIEGKHRDIDDWPKQLQLLRYFFPKELLLDFMDEGKALSYELALYETQGKLKILYDGVFNSAPRSGIHRYFYNIIANMPDGFAKYSSTTVSRTKI